MNYVRLNSLSLKYQGFPSSDSQDIGIRKFEFVAKSQVLYKSGNFLWVTKIRRSVYLEEKSHRPDELRILIISWHRKRTSSHNGLKRVFAKIKLSLG